MKTVRRWNGSRVWLRGSALLALPLVLGSTPPPSSIDPNPLRAGVYENAAALLRARQCPQAMAAIDALANSSTGQRAAFSRLAGGFYAHACGNEALAEERLFAARAPGGTLDDWRLFLLAEAAHANGHATRAAAALDQLAGNYPGSPLAPRALARSAAIAWAAGRGERALALIEGGRRRHLGGVEGAELEALAWTIGNASSDSRLSAEAARRLLVDFPSKAAELGVVERFRSASGQVDWAGILTSEEMVRRARALLALDLADSAAAVLEATPAGARDVRWQLARAEALTAARRGQEARAVLATASSSDRRVESQVHWARAQAALEAATVRSGRKNLPAAEREALRREAEVSLRRVVQPGGDRALAIRALRLLFVEATERELFERSVTLLTELKKIEPNDTTGLTYLWNKGWQQYNLGNSTGAIGLWSELASLYPKESTARAGRYWSARAYEKLGNRERAAEIYREVAAVGFDDFYRKNALARVQGKVPATTREVTPDLWPNDPALDRARLLTDLGLDGLALDELDRVGDQAPFRSRSALRALVLSRQGLPRKSASAIREAFPVLGGAYQDLAPRSALELYYPQAPVVYRDTIEHWAKFHRLPDHLVLGMIRQESAFDLTAQSHAGARGLMQLMPATARELAGKLGLGYSTEQLFEPATNIRLGTTYFRSVLDTFDGNVELALAGYNAGPNRMRRLWRERGANAEIDSFFENLAMQEPKTYVKRILVLSDSYRKLYPKPAA